MERIKGGPFIEISFLISDNKEIKFIVEYIFKNIEKCMTNFKFEENDYSISYESLFPVLNMMMNLHTMHLKWYLLLK